MGQIGATIEEMQQLQQKFTSEAATVESLSSSISSQVESTWWVGPAAERFKEEWRNQFKPMLENLSRSLNECSAEVGQRANAIQQAGS